MTPHPLMLPIDRVPVRLLHERLGLAEAFHQPAQWQTQPLVEWTMAADDHLLRQVFRQVRPLRHLEFGTWLGEGVLRCVEECDATVWTINLMEGETKPDGQWGYSELETEWLASATSWSQRVKTHEGVWVRTDSYGMIGRKYLEAGWGRRVCQIYADSREWDTRAYPDGFFDSAFIDGGHRADVVASDTRQALRLVRGGGLVMWHDFCPLDEVTRACESTREVVRFITEHRKELGKHLTTLFWVEPSWLLFGVRAR